MKQYIIKLIVDLLVLAYAFYVQVTAQTIMVIIYGYCVFHIIENIRHILAERRRRSTNT